MKYQMPIIDRSRASLLVIMMVISLSIFFSSCESYEDDYAPVKTDKPVLKTTATSLELKQKQSNNNALTLTWTPGNNEGTNSAIEYVVQIAKKGENFSDAYLIDAGKGSYTVSMKVSELNDLLRNEFGITSGGDLEFRVISKAMNENVEADTSNVVALSATAFEPKPLPENLYMVGDGAPNGWDNGNPTVMVKNTNDLGVFTWQGQLGSGDIKFLTTIGEWLPSYQKGATENSLVIRTDFSQPDDKHRIEQAGMYKITVDVIELTYKAEALAASPYNELWIVGSAVPMGWDIDNADMMFQDPSDPFIFSFNEELVAGEFKIATAKSWDAPFYRPVAADQPITETDIQLSAGDPDYKWTITEAGPYKITINLRDNKIDIKPFTPFENLWMVGDATPVGWNINSPEPMVRESDYIFTWTGQLNAGEFKFPIATGDWGTGYFMPYVADESITATNITFRPTGSPDMKFRVQPGEVGVYKITLDQLHHTILIEHQ